MKTFDKKDVFSWANCNELRLATHGYVGNSLSDLACNIAPEGKVVLLSIDENSALCFNVENKQDNLAKIYHFAFFLPSDKVKEVKEVKEKKYIPFKAMFEFVNTVGKRTGDTIRIRAKKDNPLESIYLITGYTETHAHELKYIHLSAISYPPQELLKNYEYFGDGKWQPFGMLENEN